MPETRPVTPDAPVAGKVESGIVQGVTKTETSTGADSYKTQFVKVYQDAGVIGASMLTLLVLCFLLGMFCLRLLKMYVTLTNSRDALEERRADLSEKVTERLLTVEANLGGVTRELTSFHNEQSGKLDRILALQDRMADAQVTNADRIMDRMADRPRREKNAHRSPTADDGNR